MGQLSIISFFFFFQSLVFDRWGCWGGSLVVVWFWGFIVCCCCQIVGWGFVFYLGRLCFRSVVRRWLFGGICFFVRCYFFVIILFFVELREGGMGMGFLEVLIFFQRILGKNFFCLFFVKDSSCLYISFLGFFLIVWIGRVV